MAPRTESWVAGQRTRTLILHAEDDPTIPVCLARELLSTAQNSGKQNIQLVVFPAKLGLGHNNISTVPGIDTVIGDWLAGSPTS